MSDTKDGAKNQDQLIGFAYVAGINARKAGAPITDNPFYQHGEQGWAWIDGWNRQRINDGAG